MGNEKKQNGFVGKWINAFIFINKVFAEYKMSAMILLCMMFLAAVAEAVSASTFLPLIQLITGQGTDDSLMATPARYIVLFLDWFPADKRVVYLIAVVLIINIAGTIIRIITIAYKANFSRKIPQSWRNSIMKQYVSGKLNAINVYKNGVLLNNILAEPTMASKFLLNLLELIMLSFSSVALIILMGTTNWQATLACIIAALVVTMLFYPLFVYYPLKLGKQRLHLQQNMSSTAAEAISGLKQIKAFSLEQKTANMFESVNSDLSVCMTKHTIINEVYRPIIDLLPIAGMCLFIVLVVQMTDKPLSDLSSILLFLTALGAKVFIQLSRMFSIMSIMTNSLPSMELVYNWAHNKFETENISAGKTFQHLDNDIRFSDVRYAFAKQGDILHDINLTIRKSQITVLTGPSGSGKSTILNLLLRLDDPQAGSIFIKDEPLNTFSIATWRKKIGLVTQETFIFNMSVLENILLGNPDATESQVIEAAKLAHAHEFIQQLPQGYETLLKDHGSNLSGGQRQRLAIARAIVRNPDLYILDEPTTAIDSISTQLIQETLQTLRNNGKTLVIVAHDNNLAKNADVIYVLDGGQIIEHGSYNDLMTDKGAFFRIAQAGATD